MSLSRVYDSIRRFYNMGAAGENEGLYLKLSFCQIERRYQIMAPVFAVVLEACFFLLMDIFLDFIKSIRFQTFFVQLGFGIYKLIVFGIIVPTASYRFMVL